MIIWRQTRSASVLLLHALNFWACQERKSCAQSTPTPKSKWKWFADVVQWYGAPLAIDRPTRCVYIVIFDKKELLCSAHSMVANTPLTLCVTTWLEPLATKNCVSGGGSQRSSCIVPRLRFVWINIHLRFRYEHHRKWVGDCTVFASINNTALRVCDTCQTDIRRLFFRYSKFDRSTCFRFWI